MTLYTHGEITVQLLHKSRTLEQGGSTVLHIPSNEFISGIFWATLAVNMMSVQNYGFEKSNLEYRLQVSAVTRSVDSRHVLALRDLMILDSPCLGGGEWKMKF